MTTAIRVILVEDHPMFRAGVVATLSLAGDVVVVAAASTTAQGWTDFVEHRPNVAIIGLQLPDASGLTLVRRASTELPECHVLVSTSYEDGGSVHAALRAGARDYVIEDGDADDLLRAVGTVAAGAGQYSATVVDRINQHIASGGRSSDVGCFPELTRRARGAGLDGRRSWQPLHRGPLRAQPEDSAQPGVHHHDQARCRFTF